MSRAWSHDEVRAELGAMALDALSGEERASVVAHLESCAVCRTELREMLDAAASIGSATPVRQMDPVRSAELRGRLLQRARANGGSADSPRASAVSGDGDRSRDDLAERRERARGSGRGAALPWWIAAAASIALVVTGSRLISVMRRDEQSRAALAGAIADRARLADSLRVREQTVAALAGADVKVVDLVAGNRRPPKARMFWAQATNTWTMFAHDLPIPASGRTYQLWLITRDGRKISAGTFAPSLAGEAIVSAQFALAPDALQAIAVTEEPAGGVPQPTGDIIIAGEATR